MTLGFALLLLGLLLVYAGVRGLSPVSLLVGKVAPSQTPEAAR